jgi:hypothetical protein
MRVTILDNCGAVTRYLFDRKYYRALGDFYSRLTQEGKIRTYTIFLNEE